MTHNKAPIKSLADNVAHIIGHDVARGVAPSVVHITAHIMAPIIAHNGVTIFSNIDDKLRIESSSLGK